MKVATLVAERQGMVADSARKIPARRLILGKNPSYLSNRHDEPILFQQASHGHVDNPAKLKEAIAEAIENGATPKTKLLALKIGLQGCAKSWWTGACSAEIADKYLTDIRESAHGLTPEEKRLIKGELIGILETHLLGDFAYLKIVRAIHELEHTRNPATGIAPMSEPARV